ncbi:Crp/Fnr family transcriptional regulator [Phaeodactylibacter xiamenensis]|uniref:Crp/Fnr family transcriptional regulator n=1 Tax=Phaeodactylibacter xiamenensis TaxID=1524460 RepID=UPI003BAD6170
MLFKSYLQQVASLSEEEWEAASSVFTRDTYPKGAYYIREQQYCNKISFIEKGLFKLFYLHEGAEKIMMFFSEQQFVTDYFSYLTRTPSVRPIQAVEDSVVYSIFRDDLEALFNTSKNWERIGRLLAERSYIISVQRANRLLHDDPDTRFDALVREQPELLQRVPQYMIASYLNVKPETLSRIKRRRMGLDSIKPSVHDPIDPDLT